MDINLITFRTSLSDGGIQNTGYLLAEELSKKENARVRLFCDDHSDIPSNVDTIKMQADSGWTMAFFLRIYTYLSRYGYCDVNLCLHWKCAIACMAQKLLKGTPYVVMVYGNEIMEIPGHSLKRLIHSKLRTAVLNNASVICACSSYTKELCARICNNPNIKVIHPPIKYQEQNTVNTTYTNRLFSIGRHVERKGFQKVIEAMPKILQHYPNVQYRLAGDGPYHSDLVKKVKERNLENHVTFLGKITEKQKNAEYAACDMFLMISHEDKSQLEVEGFGVCYLEAAMHGKWSVGGKSGGVTDAIVEDITGNLVDPDDSDAVADAVKCFYETPNDNIEARKLWAKQHDISIIVESYLREITEIIGEK